MTITDDMIASACAALYRETSGDFEPTNDECREILTALAPLFAAALAAQPAEPPMSACPHGVPHRWPCDKCDAPQPARVPLTGWELSRVIADAGADELCAVSGTALLRLIRAVERACAAAWGVTLADTEGGGK